jgi:hypothetical protein
MFSMHLSAKLLALLPFRHCETGGNMFPNLIKVLTIVPRDVVSVSPIRNFALAAEYNGPLSTLTIPDIFISA